MTRKEFLQGLKEALDGNMDASAIQENLNYYNEYINEEVRKGKTEQQVVDTLGDSWAIAQTLLEADENGADGGAAAGSSYGTYMKEEEGRVFEIPWWKKALFILAVVLVIVVIVSFVAGVIRILAPILHDDIGFAQTHHSQFRIKAVDLLDHLGNGYRHIARMFEMVNGMCLYPR